jgi:ABC-2 type transport system permease protein
VLCSNLNLTRELAVTSFKLKYTGSVLGYLWSLAKPLMIFGMMYLVFALFLLRGRTAAGENFPVQLLVGVVVWTFFADATSTAIQSITSNGHMILKAYFPRWILVVAATLSAAMTFVVNMLLILAVGLPLHWFQVGWQSLAFPLLLLELYVLVLGVAMLLSALFVFYRDLGHIWEILLQLLFYGSVIVFPFTLIPVRFQAWVALNPMAQIVEDVRRALVSTQIPWTASILGFKFIIPILGVFLVLGVGALTFRTLSPRFGEAL